MNTYLEIAERLRVSKRTLGITHINPDGDALGSLCFFKALVNAFQKDCVIYCAGPLPASLEFLPGFSSIVIDKTTLDFSSFDVIVSLDCATPGRTNAETEITNRKKEQVFIEIDHHPALKHLSDLELREVKAASTTEILFRLAKAAKIEVSAEMAKCLLTGIVTDTANFIHSSATEETMAVAASMMTQGAHISRINDQTNRTKTLGALKLWGVALSRLTRQPRYNLVYTILTAEDFAAANVDQDNLEGIAGFLSSLEDAAIIMVLHDSGTGEVRGSLRTIHDEIDVSALARLFGGGGHRKASGFSVSGRLVYAQNKWRIEKPTH